MKNSGFEYMEILKEIIPKLRQLEIEKKGMGYDILKHYESNCPPDIYLFFKSCLDNPSKDFKINLNYNKEIN